MSPHFLYDINIFSYKIYFFRLKTHENTASNKFVYIFIEYFKHFRTKEKYIYFLHTKDIVTESQIVYKLLR